MASRSKQPSAHITAAEVDPTKRHDLAWCALFLPALIAYLVLLTYHINAKPHIGIIEITHTNFTNYVSSQAGIEVVASDMGDARGLLWIEDESCSCSYLLIADAANNIIWKWEEGHGLMTVGKTIYRNRIDCDKVVDIDAANCKTANNLGPDCLIRLNNPASTEVDILVCEQSEHGIAVLSANGSERVIVNNFNNTPFNNPQFLASSEDSNFIYFADTPSGAPAAPRRNGYIYAVVKESLFHESLNISRVEFDNVMPNGITISNKGRMAYVTDKNAPIVHAFEVTREGLFVNQRVFFQGSQLTSVSDNLSFYGIVVHQSSVFLATSNGVVVLSSAGSVLGQFIVGYPCYDLEVGADGYLYFTANNFVLRVLLNLY